MICACATACLIRWRSPLDNIAQLLPLINRKERVHLLYGDLRDSDSINEAVRTGMPLSFFSTGQRIPEDLEEVTPGRLTSLILSGQGLRSRAVA